ncbi:hypothetical protein KKH23_09625 [Patescibacteria group bacterium]|nr:hypothetical protein [Patescibacteria group bacterium]
MKCPLFRAANIIEEFDPNWSGDDCLKEECGWWDKDRKQCSELSKIEALVAINSMLGEIAGKIPFEL